MVISMVKVVFTTKAVYDLLRVGPAALKTGSECSFTACKLRFLACFCLAGL